MAECSIEQQCGMAVRRRHDSNGQRVGLAIIAAQCNAGPEEGVGHWLGGLVDLRMVTLVETGAEERLE